MGGPDWARTAQNEASFHKGSQALATSEQAHVRDRLLYDQDALRTQVLEIPRAVYMFKILFLVQGIVFFERKIKINWPRCRC
jgi:hypothetical protein